MYFLRCLVTSELILIIRVFYILCFSIYLLFDVSVVQMKKYHNEGQAETTKRHTQLNFMCSRSQIIPK